MSHITASACESMLVAALIEVQDDSVELATSDGRQITVPIKQLDSSSQAVVRQKKS